METEKSVALSNYFVNFIIKRRVVLINWQSLYYHNFCVGLLKGAFEKQFHQRIMKTVCKRVLCYQQFLYEKKKGFDTTGIETRKKQFFIFSFNKKQQS